MKRSRAYYIKQLEEHVRNYRGDENYCLPQMSRQDALGLMESFNDFLFSLWISVGDTAFNRQGYRHATDDLLEQLKHRI
jgi:hypothetical protein